MGKPSGRCVIIGGAEIGNPACLQSRLHPDDFFVYCDCGLRHVEKLHRAPDLIVGDFDSHENPHAAAETIVLPHEKDDTDTFFAVKEALRRGYDDFLLLGVVGRRLDHTLGNVSILLYLSRLGKHAVILDDYSEMSVVAREPAYIDAQFPYFSVLNITGCARGITITGAKYPLNDAEIACDFQLGISNEVIGDAACVTVLEGELLLIKISVP